MYLKDWRINNEWINRLSPCQGWFLRYKLDLVNCSSCEYNWEINLYNQAAKSPELAARLGKDQGLKASPRVFMEHFARTRSQLMIGCQEGYLCPKS